jgi:hypothetical protein
MNGPWIPSQLDSLHWSSEELVSANTTTIKKQNKNTWMSFFSQIAIADNHHAHLTNK